MQFSGKIPILSKFWAQPPPLGSKLHWNPWPKSWIRAWTSWWNQAVTVSVRIRPDSETIALSRSSVVVHTHWHGVVSPSVWHPVPSSQREWEAMWKWYLHEAWAAELFSDSVKLWALNFQWLCNGGIGVCNLSVPGCLYIVLGYSKDTVTVPTCQQCQQRLKEDWK